MNEMPENSWFNPRFGFQFLEKKHYFPLIMTFCLKRATQSLELFWGCLASPWYHSRFQYLLLLAQAASSSMIGNFPISLNKITVRSQEFLYYFTTSTRYWYQVPGTVVVLVVSTGNL